MSIPTDIRDNAKDLLRIRSADSSQDTRVQELYERDLDKLVRETDILAERENISAVAEQSIYSVSTRSARVIAVIHNRTHLMRSSSRSLDLNTSWQSDPSGAPDEYTVDKIPPSLDGLGSITPQHIAVHPAPQVAATGDAGFVTFSVMRPSNDDPAPQYLRPYLTFRTVAAYWAGGTDEQDIVSAKFWNAMADIWLEVVQAAL